MDLKPYRNLIKFYIQKINVSQKIVYDIFFVSKFKVSHISQYGNRKSFKLKANFFGARTLAKIQIYSVSLGLQNLFICLSAFFPPNYGYPKKKSLISVPTGSSISQGFHSFSQDRNFILRTVIINLPILYRKH